MNNAITESVRKITGRWSAWIAEQDRHNPDGYSPRYIKQVGTMRDTPVYDIGCPVCLDKVAWHESITWKLECHCNLLWTVIEVDGIMSAIGRRQ